MHHPKLLTEALETGDLEYWNKASSPPHDRVVAPRNSCSLRGLRYISILSSGLGTGSISMPTACLMRRHSQTIIDNDPINRSTTADRPRWL